MVAGQADRTDNQALIHGRGELATDAFGGVTERSAGGVTNLLVLSRRFGYFDKAKFNQMGDGLSIARFRTLRMRAYRQNGQRGPGG